ncbi:MAG: tRNA (adenosine(37)-N6)-threonylcarbamoyltransferase complex dimerization subunit type 1 TsaB [Gammaproteobacteria bacterium]|nr:tRNA (adenosine(37)-N6)-threonylcarbamoyltransferase complex dimerization subunit type 1 TsaB [Gammaproteobacteria bacterium]MCF6231454.1 tRNA (adenosine(37)-N6)-threonylcarbamoyltransferase complex dimerization subunit type 1 TsaB [Gammaproteobacteria bacterium]
MSCNKILAIETSTAACSAALQVGSEVIGEFKVAPRQHSELIISMVDKLLVESGVSLRQLDSIAFSRGPGAFTGLRIAAGVVQGLAYASDLPVTPVSTLAAMAHGAFRNYGTQQVLVANDASMKEVYFGAYYIPELGQANLLGKECVTSMADISLLDEGEWLALGNGWQRYADQIPATVAEQLHKRVVEYYPDAKEVVSLAQTLFSRGEYVAAEEAIPVYLRDKVVGN